jgi:tRNA (guanine37-N1)-methyltransferase
MKITILTIFPEMFESVLNSSILGRAREQGLIEVACVDIRPFSDRKHKNTDQRKYGERLSVSSPDCPVCFLIPCHRIHYT